MGKILSKKKSVATIRIISPQSDIDPISKLLTHPLFLHSQDPLLSIMIEPLKGFIQNKDYNPDILKVKELFMDQLSQVVLNHGSEEQLNKLFKKVNQSNKTMCWRMIPMTEVFFRCLDCEVVNDSSLISGQCQDCFDKTNHEGHRVQKYRTGSALFEGCTCDCGRSDMIRPEGCCPTHQPQKQTIEQALADFPKEVRQKFTKVFKKVIYGITCMLEIQEKTDVQRIKTAIGQMVAGYTENFLSHYTYLQENLSKSFNLVTERILRSSFEAPYNRVWHDCDDHEDEDLAKNSGLKAPKQCRCTILGCILRFSKHFDKQSQAQFEQILTECFKEKDSTEFLHKEVCNHAYFLYGDPTNENNEIKKASSKLGDLFRAELIIKEGDVQRIFPLLKALNRLLLSYDELSQEKLEAVMRITGPLAIFLSNGSKVSENALTKTKVLSELLSILSDFQTSSSYPDEIEFGLFEHDIDYEALSRGLAVEKLIYFCLDHGMKTLGDKPIEIRNLHFKDFAKDWYLSFEKARAIQGQNRQETKEVNPYSGLEKTLCLMLIHYLQDNISKSSLESFFKSLFPDVNPSTLASNSIKGPLITLGLMRFVETLKAPDSELHNYYYDYGICEVDIVLSQLLTLLIDPQDLFSIFTRSFLSYSQELVDYCLAFSIPQPEDDDDDDSTDYRQMIAVLEDFLEFFIYLMNDEICLMNMNLREKLSRKRPDFPPERVLKKLFVNTLPEGIWVTISGVKAIYEKLVSTEVFTPIDSIIAKIVLQDPEQYKIKLKKEYEAELDPYIFYKFYHFNKMRQNELTSEESKTQDRDIVSGQFYTDLPSYLTDIQQNVFQSHLPDFVRNIIINFTKDISRLLQPALKLVLFNLQVVKEALENPNSSTENLQKKVQENFLTKDFSQSLNKILATGQYKECDKCINNIQGLIKQLSSRVLLRQQSTKQNIDEESKEDPIAEKKRQAKEKMEKMKEEFAKKQAAFAQKNENLLHKEDAESPEKMIENSPEKKDLVCQCCLDKIDESSTEGYGVLLYIEFTNNFYNTEEEMVFQEEEGPGIFEAKWWPVISSCNHSYHLKCFDKYFKSSRGPQNQARLFFRDDAEIQCAFCKKLHNSFLAMKPETTPKNNAAMRYMASLVYQLVSRQGSSTALDGPLQVETSFKEIMKRGYEYFVESFHLFKTAHSLHENFELYINFFNTLKACTTIEFETEAENSSFLTSIFASKATNEKIYPDLVLNKLLFTLMFEKSVLPEGDKSFSVQEHLQIIKQYILFNFVQHSSSGNKTVQLADISTLYNKNKDLINKVANELIFSMQKVLLAYYLNKCVLSSSESSERSEFCRILCSPDNTHENLNLLLKHTQISLLFDELIEESLLLINTLTDSDKNLLGSILTAQAPVSVLSRVKFAPHFQSTALPHDFLQFTEKYLKKKCELCNKYNPLLFQSICLICGRIFCGTSCDPNEPTLPGNLSKHASKCHMGLALFFLIDLHWVVLVKWPFNLVICNAPTYVSELGEWITEMFSKANFDGPGIPKSLDFKKFTLYDKIPKRMKKLIIHHAIGQEIFENASQDTLIRDLRW